VFAASQQTQRIVSGQTGVSDVERGSCAIGIRVVELRMVLWDATSISHIVSRYPIYSLASFKSLSNPPVYPPRVQ
jgi:hypothetical protein